MKKILMILGVLAMSAGAFAEDSYLYWMVGETTPYEKAYSYAKVKGYSEPDAAGSGSYLNLYYGDGALIALGDAKAGATSSMAASSQTSGIGFYAEFAANVTYSSFVVELFNDENVFVAQSAALNYADAAAYIALKGIGAPSNMVWAASSYAVPEPNSALMLLLGSAVLALRRRKQV